MDDLFALIRNDHRRIQQLIERLIAQNQQGHRLEKSDLDTLRTVLLSHCRAEEHILYDSLKRLPQTQPSAYQAFEEHHVAELMINELEQVSDARVLMAKLRVLGDFLGTHMQKEEEQILPDFLARVEESEKQALQQAFVDLQEQIQSHIFGRPLAL